VATRADLVAADRDITGRVARLGRAAGGTLGRSTTVLDRALGHVESGGRAHLRTHDQALAAAAQRLVARAPRAVTAAGRTLDGLEAQIRLVDPARTLARGWSITRDARGTVVRSPADVAAGARLVTTVAGGEVRSTVDGGGDDEGGAS
jgi:exodeoxyribonuclease VII large subunit